MIEHPYEMEHWDNFKDWLNGIPNERYSMFRMDDFQFVRENIPIEHCILARKCVKHHVFVARITQNVFYMIILNDWRK